MEYFTASKRGRVFLLRLDRGDLCLESIETLIQQEGLQNGVVTSGIGTFDRTTLHMVTTTGFPPVEHFETWTDLPLEVMSIDGLIIDTVPHLHCTVADTQRAYGGHLEYGCRTLYLCEIMIEELLDVSLTRVLDEHGIKKLVAKP
jgi:predicted DNA-binding protein with PD1-like motif